MAQIKAKIEYGKLKKYIEEMSKKYSVKVGILAEKNQDFGNIDLAGIGAVHEFGAIINVTDKMRGFFRYHFKTNLKSTTKTIVIPARSFLTMPLADRAKELRKKFINKFGSAEGVEFIVEKGDLESLAVLLGASAVEQVKEAFATAGFGTWDSLSQLTIDNRVKPSDLPLNDTGTLKNSITFEVEGKNG